MSIIEKNGLKINTKLFDFVNNEIIPGTNIKKEEFWSNFGNVVHELAPINKNLIQKREDIQKKIVEVKKIVKEVMTSVSSSDHHMFSIPLEVSINSGNNWGEAH